MNINRSKAKAMTSAAMRKLLLLPFSVISLLLVFTLAAYANSPGTDSGGVGTSDVNFGSLLPIVTESGLVSLSIDGLGTTNSSGIIQVDKPAGATVRSAYLAAASTGFSRRVLNNGDVLINGTGVNWTFTTPSSISSSNHWADVTTIVKSTLDAAPAGRVDFSITEISSSGIDGEILVVIFDDPNQTSTNTIVLAFGAQDVNGDTFAITLADPINLSDPNLVFDMSLGISFGAQGCSSGQFSQVDVNGTRMTTSAGGEDDGICSNGALLTVGGLGDVNTNPNPAAPPAGPRTDDELYNLIPFVANGDTTINVFSRNPSNDDNIFFAALRLSGQAIVGEGILLTPLMATNPLNTDHMVTALVQDVNGNPVVNREVTFKIVAGPHVGLSTVARTDSSGQATLTYRGTIEGTDIIEASFVNSRGVTTTSNQVTKNWRQPISAASIELTPKTATNPINTQHCVVALVKDQNGAPMSGINVAFTVTGVNPTSGSGTTNASGQAEFCYIGANAGEDTITATAGSLSDTATKRWQAPTGPEKINVFLELRALSTSYRSQSVPGGPAGTMAINATFKNISTLTFNDLYFQVAQLTGGNLLLNADGGPGGVGAKRSVPNADLGADNVLTPNESFQVTYVIGLATRNPFSFFVDAYGTVVGGVRSAALGAEARSFQVDLEEDAFQNDQIHDLFLPLAKQ